MILKTRAENGSASLGGRSITSSGLSTLMPLIGGISSGEGR